MDSPRHHNDVPAASPAMPNYVPHLSNEDINAIKNDFIRHPLQIPVRIKRRRSWRWFSQNHVDQPSASVGLSFHARTYIPCGERIEVSIPLRGEAQTFEGTVILVRELDEGFEIGLWLSNDADATRARIVEKICHTECYLQSRTRHSSPSDPDHGVRSRDWLHLQRPLMG